MSTQLDPDTAALSALGQIAQGLLSTQAGGDLSYGTLKRGFREVLRRDPLESIAAVVLGGSYLFYLAEKGETPRSSRSGTRSTSSRRASRWAMTMSMRRPTRARRSRRS